MIKEEFLDRIKNEISKEDFDKYIKSLNEKPEHGFTLNLKKLSNSSIDIDYVLKKFDAEIIFKNENYVYLKYDKEKLESKNIFVGKDALYHLGLYYIQEPSAFIPISKLVFDEDDIVLDLCAAPGGKSCQILYNIKDGFLLSNEIDYKRAKILSSNIERMGFDNVVVLNNDISYLESKFINSFDKIIIDAPCSGEGMFRKSEEAKNQWSKNLVKSCFNIQKQLVKSAYNMLKSGGTLLYSTCTFSKEEDEEVVSYFLSLYDDMKLVEKEKIYPFQNKGEGQFYAIFKKNGNLIHEKIDINKIKNDKKLKIIRCGINEYEIIKNEKIPTHEMTHNEKLSKGLRCIELDDKEVIEYLHGDVIRKNIEFNGWCKITYKNIGLGVGKVVNGVIKNHYPKGLRNM